MRSLVVVLAALAALVAARATCSRNVAAEAPGAEHPEELAPLHVSIDQALRRAVRGSYLVKVARAQTERARANVVAARAPYFPQIAANGSYLRTIDSLFLTVLGSGSGSGLGTGTGTGSDEDDMGMGMGSGSAANQVSSLFQELPFATRNAWDGEIDTTQLVFDGYRTPATVSLAKRQREIAELGEHGQVAQVVLTTTAAYYDAALAERLVVINERSLNLAEQTLAETRLGFQQGSTAEYDVVRSEVTRDTQRTRVVQARANRDVAMIRLRQLLKVPLDRPLVLTTELSSADASELARATAGVGLEPERLPIAQARKTLDARKAQVLIAKSALWPQIYASMNVGAVAYPRTFFPSRSDWFRNWTVGVTVSVPIFTGFYNTSQIAGARADERAAQALLEEAIEQTAVADVQARTTAAAAYAALDSSASSTVLARRAYEIAELRYRQGVSTYLDLLDARVALEIAETNEAQAARDLQVSRVQVALLPALPLSTTTATVTTTTAAAPAPQAATPSAAGYTSAATAAGTAAPPRPIQPTPTGTGSVLNTTLSGAQ